MSYYVTLEINTGLENTEIDSWNYTFNCRDMFNTALGKSSIDGIGGLDMLTAKDAISPLRIAIAHMEDNPDIYKPMNPSNGWGNYGSAMEFLRKILAGCINHPACTIRV
jgi:hypothetical protein